MELKKPTKHEKTSINTRDRWAEVASGRQELQSSNCSAVQAAVGCSVTLTCNIRRRSWLSMIRTKRIRKVAVGTVKKSSAMISLAWFERNVRQVWDGGPRRLIMYLETAASETSIPSFNSSPWIRGAPHNGLARHIRRIRCRISGSILGRPRRRLFQRQ